MVALLLTVCIPFVGNSSMDAAPEDSIWIKPFTEKIDRQSTVPEGYIGIFSPDDLNKIGTDVDSIYDDPQSAGNKLKWSMDAKYIQMGDLDLTGRDINGGFDVRITITTGADLTIHAEYDTGFGYTGASGVDVWVEGRKITAGASGTAVYSGYDISMEYSIIIGGSPGSNDLAVAFQWSDGMPSTIVKDSNGNLDPIGSSASPFTGVYDGNGWKIMGAEFATHSAGEAAAALFGYFKHSTTLSNHVIVKNLGMEGGSSTAVSKSYAWASNILGKHIGDTYPTVENCYNNSDVFSAGKAGYAGGIVAFAAVPLHCSNSATITGFSDDSGLHVGGVVGNVPGLEYIRSCYNSGNVYGNSANTTDSLFVGGIAGYATRGVFECFNSGTIKATAGKSVSIAAGGLIGHCESAIYCCNSGEVILSAPSFGVVPMYIYIAAGGIAGSGTISFVCYNRGSVTVADVHASNISDAYIGGIMGRHDGGNGTYGWTLHHSYFLEGLLSFNGVSYSDVLSSYPTSRANYEEETNNTLSEPTVIGLGAMDTDEMKDPSNYIWWEIGSGNIWSNDADVNDGYPFLLTFLCTELLSDPSSCAVDIDSDAVFSVDVGSAWDLTYQWQIDRGNGWEDLSDVGNVCIFPSVKEEHNGSKFRCMIYSEHGVITSDVATLTVVPLALSVTVDYDLNGGTGMISSATGPVGTGLTISDGTGVRKEGYTLAGWSDAVNGIKKYDLGESTLFTSSMTLYALWIANDHTVTFADDGGSVTVNCCFDESIRLHDGTGFTKNGHTLAGWSSTQGASSHDYELGCDYVVSGDAVFYAVWKPIGGLVPSVEHDDCFLCMILNMAMIFLSLTALVIVAYAAVLGLMRRK